jgi:putative PEP-CTERM system histidine kinase
MMMLGGDAAFTSVAFLVLVALVLLAILLISDRARLYTRRFISRHFQRPLHDYRTVWHSFAAGTASCVEQTTLCRTSAKLVADIFQALAVTIWLVDDRKERLTFAASTFLSETNGRELEPPTTDSIEVIRAFQHAPEPVDIDAAKSTWAIALRGCHPQEFQKGGRRLCVPLMGGGTVLGVMTLGDRVGGVAFSLQDFDLLTCVGSQVGASLLNVQLAHKLVQAKELEAFQTMSAFFVHDLKNTASTLNLMLQNLPVHFDNPAFREDALRGIEKTATHINNLISRLGLLRHDLTISPSQSDLNDVVAQALTGWEKTADVELIKDLQPLTRVQLDQEQMVKVVTNLVLNAREAVAAGGQVRVTTRQQTGWAVLTVADNGCGMAPEFLRRSLFRPFQTTKKSGLGIGMFQSKMIVEAHGGRMEVESEVGKGTTFRVLLPQGTHNQ